MPCMCLSKSLLETRWREWLARGEGVMFERSHYVFHVWMDFNRKVSQQTVKPIFVARSDDSKNSNAFRHIAYNNVVWTESVYMFMIWVHLIFGNFKINSQVKFKLHFGIFWVTIWRCSIFLFHANNTEIYFAYDDAASQP